MTLDQINTYMMLNFAVYLIALAVLIWKCIIPWVKGEDEEE